MADIDLQVASQNPGIPDSTDIQQWLSAAAPADKTISLRIVDSAEMQALNLQYRHMDKPTNVLSFPAELPPELELPLLGDIVACAEVIEREASAANRDVRAHWAHILVHGTLHLMGYDHIDDADAEVMETLEINILAQLGFPNPYA